MVGSDQPKRKRNVVSRDRLGCISCRTRRLRCDKTKPECLNCTRTNRQCEGYVNPILFRDQTNVVVQKAQNQAVKRRRTSFQPASESSQLSESAVLSPIYAFSPAAEPAPAASSKSPLQDPINLSLILANVPAPSTPSTALDFMLPSTPEGVDWTSNWQQWDLSDIIAQGDPSDGFLFSPQSALVPNEEEQSPPTRSDSNETFDSGFDILNNLLHPDPSAGVCEYSHPAFAAFQFSPDHDYYRYLCNGSVKGFKTIMPLVDLISDDRLASSHLYSAALAVSALSVSSLNGATETNSKYPYPSPTSVPKPIAKRHALRHYSAALRSLSRAFPTSNPDAFHNASKDQLLGWLMTRLLLSNIDLRLGSLAAWRAHLRAVGRVISACHGRISQYPQGQALIHTFARMALLLELENEEFAVTKQGTMNPCIAAEIASMIEHSASPRDRLLALIRDVSKLEVKYRLRPDKSEKWISKMENIEAELFEWQRRLPPSELPVDTGIAPPVNYTADDGIYLTPLTFPNSADSHTAAVNYAHFLCARMRSRTRYGPISELLPPDDAETSILYICRIAAGLNPSNCKEVDAYGHGMMPAIVGAFRWSSDERIRRWIVGWLKGYGGLGAREGLWNVDRTRRLMLWIDENYKGTAYKEWHLIIARIVENGEDGPESLSNEEMVWDKVVRRADKEDEVVEIEDDEGRGDDPFRVVMYTRSETGPATQYFTVP